MARFKAGIGTLGPSAAQIKALKAKSAAKKSSSSKTYSKTSSKSSNSKRS